MIILADLFPEIAILIVKFNAKNVTSSRERSTVLYLRKYTQSRSSQTWADHLNWLLPGNTLFRLIKAHEVKKKVATGHKILVGHHCSQ